MHNDIAEQSASTSKKLNESPVSCDVHGGLGGNMTLEASCLVYRLIIASPSLWTTKLP